LDSAFCSGFHKLKEGSSPTTAYVGGVALLFSLWSIAMCFVVTSNLLAVREQLNMRQKALQDLDGDGSIDVTEVAQQYVQHVYFRTQAFINAQAEESILKTAAKWTVVFIPWPFYVYVFQVCWDCYDFQAAAAHEIGHLLGLSHPDTKETELRPGYVTAGENSYSSLFAEGSGMNTSTCLHPWDYVTAGIPAGVGTTAAGVRKAMMEAFTTHNPSVCLSQDDYEGLLTLYPVCEGATPEPICAKTEVNIGFLRVTVFILGPFITALLISIMIHFCVDHKEKEESRAEKLAVRMRRKSAAAGPSGEKARVHPIAA